MAFGSYRGAIVDQYGNAISGVTVTVYLEGTLTPATLASDRAETVLVNPFTNESDGSYEFWASTTAAYDIVFSLTFWISFLNDRRRLSLYCFGLYSFLENPRTSNLPGSFFP